MWRIIRKCLRPDDFPPQIPPIRIPLSYQPLLPIATPLLDPLFARNGELDVVVWLEPNERLAPMRLGKAGDQSFAIFRGAAQQVVGHAGIERAAFAIGHNVDVVH